MNRHLYRIIFNRRRGELMVVGENAASQGKAPGSKSIMSDGAGGGGAELTLATLRPACLAVFSALGMLLFVTGAAHGQVVADRNAPGNQRPTVLQTANGVPQVNIQTPSAAGVSRNTYSQFDVQSNGVILNNSRGNTQTQTGGWVQGNPWLAGGNARVILNEVNSTNPSQLRGYVEVAGQRAEVIIANPAGVAVDGGGFINASRVTLTTGSPIVNGGNLDGYVVQRGVVSVSGRGLDTSQSDYTAILARAVQVNAGIWANDLRVVTGANRVDANLTVGATASGDDATPAFALDVAQLGGMYAGKITLIGTEAGIGTRNAGTVAASAGNVVLQSDGWISNSGYIQSGGEGGKVQARAAGNLQNAGTIYAAGDTSMSSGGDISNSGLIAAAGNTALHGGGRIDSGAGAVLAAGLNADNLLRATGDLTVEANTRVGIHGIGAAGSTMHIAGAVVDLAMAKLSSQTMAATASQGDLDASRATLTAHGTLALEAARVLRTDGAQATGEQIHIAAHELSNVGGQILQLGEGDLALRLPGQLDNSAGRIATNSRNLTVEVAVLVNSDGKIEHAGTGALAIHAASLAVKRGQITSNGDVMLAGDAVDHREATTLARHLTVQAGTLDNHGGSLIQTGTQETKVHVARGMDNSDGRLETNGSLDLSAASVLSEQGRIAAAQDVNMNVAGRVDNTSGVLAAGHALALHAGDVNNTRGQLQAVAGAATLAIIDLNNTGGSVFAAGDLAIAAGKVDNSGSLYAGANQNLQVTGAVVNTGVIAAQGHTTLQAASLASSASSLLGAGVKADGSLLTVGDLRATTAQALRATGQNLAAGHLDLNGASVDLTGSETGAAQIALTATQGDVLTRQALVTTPGTLTVTAGAHAGQTLVNEQGKLSAGQLDLQLSNLDNRDGTLVQTGAGDTRIVLKTPAGLLDNTGGRIAVNSANVALGAGKLINTDGKLEHAGTGTLVITAATLDGERSRTIGNGKVSIDAGAMRHDQASTVGHQVTLHADSLSNRGGHLLQTGEATMTVAATGQLNNAGGEISGNGSVVVQAGTFDNSQGRITAAQAAQVSSVGGLGNSDGVLAAGGALQVSAAALDNTRGLLQAGTGALEVTAASLLNRQGTLSAATDLVATVAGDVVNTGLLYAGRNVSLQAGSVDSSGLLGAGLRADGTLGQAGNLNVTAKQAMRATGQNLAAGDATLDGASLDLTGSQSSAANIALTARAGDIDTSKAVVNTAGLLAITAKDNNAQALVNAGGQLSAGQLALAVANVRNVNGDIMQLGTGDVAIELSTPGGVLDNTGGRIAVNSGNLSLGAGELINIDGKLEHAGTGTLTIRAAKLSGQRGQITGNGALSVTADDVDHSNASTIARHVTVAAGTLDNRQGEIVQLGSDLASIVATRSLDNSGGKIAANGDVQVEAATLLNDHGRIASAQNISVSGSTALNNRDGNILAGRKLTLRGGDVDNTHGQIQALDGNADLMIGDLNNSAGKVFASGDLNTVAANVVNSGSLYAGANQSLRASGAVSNAGAILAQGHTTIDAGSLSGDASSLLGAGVKADGSLQGAGDLNVTTVHALGASGQNLAAGNMAFSGAKVGLAGSQTSASNIALNASAGDISTSGAVVTTPGTLEVKAANQYSQRWENGRGQVSAGQLTAQVANLGNVQGSIIQTGSGATSLKLTSLDGVLDNSDGRIAVNSVNLNLNAGTLANTNGKIEHAGSGALTVHLGQLNGVRGQITSNGGLDIKAAAIDHRNASTIAQQVAISSGTLDNRQGNITQLGLGKTVVGASQNLDNRGGTIASNGSTSIAADSLNNQGGTLQQAGSGSLDIRGGSTLDNSMNGVIAAGGNFTAAVGELLNQGAKLTAGGSLNANVAQALRNEGGLLAATGNVDLTLGALDNTRGKVAAVQGNVNLVSGGVMKNDSGSFQAAGDIAIQSTELSNTVAAGQGAAGMIVGKNIRMDTGQWALDNHLGTIAASQTLSVSSGPLTNDGGLLQSGTSLRIDTRGHVLGNGTTDAYAARNPGNAGGIVSGGDAVVSIGSWNNTAGYFGAAGAISGTTGLINNAGGQILGQSSLALSGAGLDNQNGQIQVVGKLSFATPGTIDNRKGLIRSGALVSLTASTLDNSMTQASNQGIEGPDAILTAGALNNQTGALRVDGNLSMIASGTFDNTQGLASAGKTLSVADQSAQRSLAIINTGGTVIAGALTDISAASLTGDGRVLSQQDMRLDVSGSYSHSAGAELIANRDLALSAGGAVLNMGKLRAGGTLSLQSTNSIENSAGGDISGTTTRLNTAGLLVNRGVVDGVATEINADIVHNMGSGRIYGDQLSIRAGTLNNDVENGVAATIAARDSLHIGAKTINNLAHALIFSANTLSIGGSLDGNRQATGRATALNNASATIEALGNLDVGAEQINNLNKHIQVEMSASEKLETVTEYQGAGAVKRYAAGTPGVATYDDESLHLSTPDGNYEKWTLYQTTRTSRQSEIVSSDPGRIIAGGNISIGADLVANEDSHIIAGGLLDMHGSRVINGQTQGQKITNETGTSTAYWRDFKKGRDRTGEKSTAYAPAEKIENITLNIAREDQLVAAQGSGTSLSAAASGGTTASTSTAGVVSAQVQGKAIVSTLAGLAGVDHVTGGQAAAVSGGSGLNGTTRLGGAGQAATIDPVTGAAAVTVAGTNMQSQASLAPGIKISIGHASGSAAQAVSVGGAPGQARLAGIVQVALAHPAGQAQVVRTSAPSIALPNASLFRTLPSPSSRYLVETDPRFANFREWMGSDYFLKQVTLDPNVTQKRLGDGFYEQKLIREQVAQLTGRRFVGDYSSDEQQYCALMDAGVAYANAWDLRPGLALTPGQMAALTSDIVWLVERDVTLADGSVQKALVPQIYLRLRDGDLDGSGALLAGKDININLSGDLTNSGTIAGRSVVKLTAENVANMGGRLHGDAVAVAARNDLNNIGGTISANSALVATAGRDIHINSTTQSASNAAGGNSFSRTDIDRVAGLYVSGDGNNGGGTLVVSAGRDLSLLAGVIGNAGKDGQTMVSAGRDIKLGTLTTASRSDLSWDPKNYRKDSSSSEVGSQIQGSGSIALRAGNDLIARAAEVQAGAGLAVKAGHDIVLSAGANQATVDEGHQHASKGFLNSKTITTRDAVQTSTALGTSLTGKSVDIVAGHDLKVAASSILAHEAANLMARNDIAIESVGLDGQEVHSKQVKKNSTFGLSKSLSSQADDGRTTTQAASSISGASVTMVGGRDIAVKGSTLVADGDVAVTALRDLRISSAENDKDTTSSSYSKKSGLIGSLIQPAIGSVKTTSDGKSTGVAQVGSQIASLGGNVALRAGETYTQTASEVLATGTGVNGALPGDISIVGKNVLIKEAYNSNASEQHTTFSKVALGGTVNVPIVDAVKSIGSLAKAAEQTKDSRMQALAAVTLASKATDLAGMASKGLTNTAGIKISVSLGSSKSESDMHQSSSTVVGSAVNAAGNVSIVATGAGAGSDLTVAGSKIAAGGNLTLFADDKINLLAAKNTATQTSKNSSSGSSIGIGYTFGGTQNGFSLDLAANQARGKADGTDIDYTNTYVTAGKTATVISGGDTNLHGAVLEANTVKAGIGGDLNIVSLQDTSTYASKNSSAGFNMSLCIPPFCYGASSIGGSVSKSKTKGDFASVTEQSGIKAGDGGFQIQVAGNTDLQAGLIASSGKAITDGKNALSTGTLTTSELQNKDQHAASGFSLSGSLEAKVGTQNTASTPEKIAAANSKSGSSGSAGFGGASGSQGSTTTSAISGGAILISDAQKQQALTGKTTAEMLAGLNRDVSSEKDSSGALKKGWDGKKLEQEVQAQVAITEAFSKAATAEIGKFANGKLDEADKLKKAAGDVPDGAQREEMYKQAAETEHNWSEGGSSRVLANALAGALGGGLIGAAASSGGSSASGLLYHANIPESLKALSYEQQARVQKLATDAGFNEFTSKEDWETLRLLTNLRFDPESQNLPQNEVNRRIGNYLSLRGASPQQIAEVTANFANAGLSAVNTRRTPNVEVRLMGSMDAPNGDVEHQYTETGSTPGPFLGTDIIDKGTQGVGGVLIAFGNYVESNMIAKYTVETLDFASGPIIYGVKKLPAVENLMGQATDAVGGYFTRGFEGAGYTGEAVVKGKVGSTSIVAVSFGGFSGMIKNAGKSFNLFGKKVLNDFYGTDSALKNIGDGVDVSEWKGPTDYSHIPNPKNIEASTKPTPRQVREMKKANRENNDGLLRDDVTGEILVDSKKSQSGVIPPSNEAQIDHRKPVNAGGTREQYNLLLRSRKGNRDKSDKWPLPEDD
ncbi:hemagglutinin repeat-containing protein [Janthinobacterium sp. NFX145]|uniref:two-partner secretion domain-containing protein n=1 Tax=Janthinobacterium sp. NFX145 TaxID=3415602 RepID=UPI003CC667B3